ncbi:MAG: fibronectin type III domain-containing protein, partial [Candidatus Pacebacteria bacterium]|nr:fibronectin type III domain-containing protein [Candidatus Paceibacterota bacterium]
MKDFIKGTSFLGRILTGLVVLGTGVFVALAADATPPTVNDIVIQDVTEDTATIIWKTNDKADSQVNYGLSNNYGIERVPVADKTAHEVALTDLEPATTYHFRVVSSDEFGNQTVSGDFTLTTDGVVEISTLEEVIEEEDQQKLAAKALAIIDQITDPEALILITDQITEVAERLLFPPTIIGAPLIEEVGENYAVISWKTDRESTSLVFFASEDSYDPTAIDPYTSMQGGGQEHVIKHLVEVTGLKPATKYHFQVFSEDILGFEGKSRDETFTTTSPLPLIRDLRITKVEETSATFSWSTTVPAGGYVEYTNLSTGETRVEGSPELISGHTVRITDLVFGTQYSAIVRAENATGDKVISDPMVFLTV